MIWEKYDKKGNNKLSNLCKELGSFTYNSNKDDPDDWFTDLSHLNNSIEKIIIDFKDT